MPDYSALARRFGGQTLRQGTASINVTDPIWRVTDDPSSDVEAAPPETWPTPPVEGGGPPENVPPGVGGTTQPPATTVNGSESPTKTPTAADAKGYSLGDYTYAGFEPTSLTRNLTETDPARAGKDWVHRYLVQNQINPNSKSWAPDAAAALNKQYNTDVFRAIDGETLGWGDEYTHSAPNGYGLQRGQYDPNAKGQFFWGSTTPRDDAMAPTTLGGIGRMSLSDARSRLTAAAKVGYGDSVNPTDDQLRQYAEHYGFKTPAGATDTDASIIGQLEQKLRSKADAGYWQGAMGTPPPFERGVSVGAPNQIAPNSVTPLNQPPTLPGSNTSPPSIPPPSYGQDVWVNGQPFQQGSTSLANIGSSTGGQGTGQMVMLRAPDGTTKQVPASQQAHYVSRGATVVGGA